MVPEKLRLGKWNGIGNRQNIPYAYLRSVREVILFYNTEEMKDDFLVNGLGIIGYVY